jgi:hypothetical protein
LDIKVDKTERMIDVVGDNERDVLWRKIIERAYEKGGPVQLPVDGKTYKAIPKEITSNRLLDSMHVWRAELSVSEVIFEW